MQDLNKIFIIGRLTRDPELSFTATQIPVCKMSIANNGYKEKVNFFNLVAWKKTAELCNQYLKKGKQVAIEGTLQQRSYTFKDGNKKNIVEINIDKIQFIGSKEQEENKTEKPENKQQSDDADFPTDFNDGEDMPY